jgi:O-antigen ligase
VAANGMKKTLTALMVVSLVGNVLPAFNILAISGLFPLYLVNRDSRRTLPPKYAPDAARKWLIIAYVYWICSYLATSAPVGNLFSFDFIRFDGALLIAYVPLLLMADLRLDPQFIQRLLRVFLSAMSLVALLGLAEFVDRTLTPLGLSWLPDPLQFMHNASLSTQIFHGFFRAHNAAGAIYAMVALLAFSLLVRGEKPSLLSWQSFWFAASVIGLMLTQSRTAYAAFFATVVIMFCRRGSLMNAMKYGVLILLPILYFLLLQPTVSRRTQQVSDLEDPNVVTRFFYYQRAFDDFLQSPIVGTGFGRFNDQLKIYSGAPHLLYFATGGSVENNDEHAHNSYLHFLAEGGIVGLGLMLGVWVSLFCWIRARKKLFVIGSFGYCFAQGIEACITLEFFMSFTEHMMGTAVSSLTILTMTSLFLNLVGWKYRIASLTEREPAQTAHCEYGPEHAVGGV